MLVYILFILGFIVLVKGADLLTDGASALAKRFRISDLVIGLTVVAFGTSAPELFINVFSAYQGTSDIALGNVIGSNIANILLILGITAVIYPLTVGKGVVWREIPFSLAAVIILGLMANDVLLSSAGSNVISRVDGLLLLALFMLFIYHMFTARRSPKARTVVLTSKLPSWRSVLYIILGLTGLVVGGQWIVNGAIEIAGLLGLSETLIALTIIAVGTSLPEMATSIVAALKKSADIAVGNAVGSSIFNIFLVLGVTGVILPLQVPAAINFDLAVLAIASLMLFIWMFVGKKRVLDRKAGVIFLTFYIIYVGMAIARG